MISWNSKYARNDMPENLRVQIYRTKTVRPISKNKKKHSYLCYLRYLHHVGMVSSCHMPHMPWRSSTQNRSAVGGVACEHPWAERASRSSRLRLSMRSSGERRDRKGGGTNPTYPKLGFIQVEPMKKHDKTLVSPISHGEKETHRHLTWPGAFHLLLRYQYDINPNTHARKRMWSAESKWLHKPLSI